MPFQPPTWVPALSQEPPDSIPICDFMLDEQYGRHSLATSKAPFTCGLTGAEYSASEVKTRVQNLGKSIAQDFGWDPNRGSEWEKVIAVFALNTVYSTFSNGKEIDTMTVVWAIHSLSGVATLANAAYSTSELAHQLKSSGAKALFTCTPLLKVALAAAKIAGIPSKHIYLLHMPSHAAGIQSMPQEFKSVNELIAEGQMLPPLPKLVWEKGQGARQVALLSYSSGTSGAPKAVMISHLNVINNILQIEAFERPQRGTGHQSKLGMMPQSHIYGLVVICHATVYVGDSVVTLPRYKFDWMLAAAEKYRIETMFLVPPVIITLTKNHEKLRKFDLSCVKTIWTGAAPLGRATALELQEQHPTWKVLQGYGLTETCTLVSSSSPHDQWLGSSGSLLPGMTACLFDPEGNEITAYDTPGELHIYSLSNALGYLNNEDATLESFPEGWMRTGDEAVFRKGRNGHEHLFIVDRIKELIKVKGHQVAPAELEARLLSHPAVADVAVIQVPDEAAGELPKAFIVRSKVSAEVTDKEMRSTLYKHAAHESARYKWLDGGIDFIDEVPKSPSGKILRRLLRDQEAKRRSSASLAKL